MSIAVAIRHRLGDFTLDARFTDDGRLIALFGPSGAGKTSLIKVIAGLIHPDEGRVVVDDHVLVDTAQHIFLPSRRRRIGYVFQEGRLFPHLTVRQNLLYGSWFAPKSARAGNFDEVVDLLGIAPLLGRRPAGLSGGETQRVAIGRALLASPLLLLMDEPLAALDAERRAEIFPYIERLRDQAHVPIVYVSHTITEVARLATTVVLMENGRVMEIGPVAKIFGRADLAPLLGLSEAGAVLEAHMVAHEPNEGLTRLSCGDIELRVLHLLAPVGSAVRVLIPARDVMLATTRPQQVSALNVLAGRVAAIVPHADGTAEIRVDLTGANGQGLLARITQRSVKELDLAVGREVFAVLKTVAVIREHLGGGAPLISL